MRYSRTKSLVAAPSIVAIVLLTACGSMAPPQPPSLELPKPPSDLRAVRKGDTVILTWTVPDRTTDKQRIRTVGEAQISRTQICRGNEAPLTQCGAPVGQAVPLRANSSGAKSGGGKSTARKSSVFKSGKKSDGSKSSDDKITTSYTDPLPAAMESINPSAVVTYAVEVLNADGRGAGLSNQVQVPTIRTLPPPPEFGAKVTKQGVVLSWQGQRNSASSDSTNSDEGVWHIYRVFRRQEGSEQENLVGDAPWGTRTLTDSTFEWEKTYFYRVETVTLVIRPDKTELQIEGADSSEVKVFADDVFPPAVPAGLQAVFSGPGQQAFIDLVWAPVTDLDLNGYNIYRREEGSAEGAPPDGDLPEKSSAWVKINSELVKTSAYWDANVSAGKNYVYAVSAVDVRGNESARSEEANERVP